MTDEDKKPLSELDKFVTDDKQKKKLYKMTKKDLLEYCLKLEKELEKLKDD